MVDGLVDLPRISPDPSAGVGRGGITHQAAEYSPGGIGRGRVFPQGLGEWEPVLPEARSGGAHFLGVGRGGAYVFGVRRGGDSSQGVRRGGLPLRGVG